MKIRSGATEKFASYSSFRSVKELNSHMEQWLVEHTFTKSELIGLKQLIRFSAKYPGVCNAKIGTILKETHNGRIGISRSTFKRLLKKASAIGLLTIYETTRKNGSQTSNLYVFNRFPSPTNDPSEMKKKNQPIETSNLLKTTNKDIKKRTETLDASYTSDSVPSSFTITVKPFYNRAHVIEDYWKMAKIAAYQNNREGDQEVVLHTAIHAFKQMIGTWKRGSLKNPIAYFYGILMKKFEVMYFEELDEMGFRLSPEEESTQLFL